MTTYTFTLIDIRRVQGYLFNANELRQNLGASLLVEQATHHWMIENLPTPHNVGNGETYQPRLNEKTIDRDGLKAEVIFMGGGNVAILFVSRPEAVDFARRYTRHLLLNAPGLEVAVGHVDVDWDRENGLKEAWEELQTKVMPARKEGRAVAQMLPGLAVTTECVFTGLPAVEEMRKLPDRPLPKILVSAEAQVKRKKATVEAAKTRLGQLLPPKQPFAYPDDLEKLGGKKGRSRYIAVVHADGNEMGKRINRILTNISDNRERVKTWRELSNAINHSGLKAMEVVTSWLREAIRLDKETGEYILKDLWKRDNIRYREDEDDNVTYLPIRPIVFGGDDITFVCEGRLGIALAVKFLQAFHAQPDLPDGKLYACAGVAIVHHNYPFARAYDLAEQLAKEAKRQAQKYDPKKRASLIHWHISTSGLTLDWDDIHQREYQVDEGDMLLRPLLVNRADDVSAEETSWRTWDVFVAQVKAFRMDSEWQGRRSKLKELREVLRQGEGAARDFTRMHENLPAVIAGQTDYMQTGWYSGRCVYFDALDADDWLIYPNDGKEEIPNA